MKNKWIVNCGLKKSDKVDTLRLCSAHFNEKDFTGPVGAGRRLSSASVPTVKVPGIRKRPLLQSEVEENNKKNTEGEIFIIIYGDL